MATFTISSATSIFSEGVGFQRGTVAADTLVVQADAHIVTDRTPGTNGVAVLLKGPGAWTATIGGNVYATFGIGLELNAGLPLSTIAIGVDGSITGGFCGIEARGPVAITNSGEVASLGFGDGSAAFRFLGTGEHRITNFGVIAGSGLAISDAGNAGTEIIDNRGVINGKVILRGGNDRIVNRGDMTTTLNMGNGADSVTNSGSMVGSFDFGAGNNTLTNSGTFGSRFVLYLSFGDGNDTINNTGEILNNVEGGGSGGVAFAFEFGNGANTLTNSGTFESFGFNGGSGVDRITNSGNLSVGDMVLLGGNDVVVNSGTFISENVNLGAGTNSFTNTARGDVRSNVIGGTGVDTFNNRGVFTGNIDLREGADVFTNGGDITGSLSFGGADSLGDRLTNSGTITGFVGFGRGNDIVVNSGMIDGTVNLTAGFNRFTNSGVVTGGFFGGVTSQAGYNIFYNYVVVGAVKTSGTVLGEISLSFGNDQFYGGENAERVSDSLGADRYVLGGGDDIYTADFITIGSTDALDTVDGGAGSDTLRIDETGVTGGQIIVNLDTVAHRYGPGFADPAGGLSTANRVSLDGTLYERVFNFENVTGSDDSDIIYGNAAANAIAGGGGSDVLHGYAGNDTLDGGDDIDVLVGGRGRDVLTGGTGVDYFNFISVLDSMPGAARDVIIDFNPGTFPGTSDAIVLAAIDANTANGAAVNDAFNTFIGVNVAFGLNAPGTLRAVTTASGWILEGNTDNDRAAEFQIAVNDATHAISWSTGLFFL